MQVVEMMVNALSPIVNLKGKNVHYLLLRMKKEPLEKFIFVNF